MTDNKTPAEIELEDAVASIRGVGENATGNAEITPAEEGGADEHRPNPPLPDWGSDGIAAEDEPQQ